MKHGTSLVAAPDSSTSSPVAKGSSVPAWPVRARVRRRSAATSANDEGPAGLSTSATPTGLSARGGIRSRDGEHELTAQEVDDLGDRLLGREPGRLAVAAAADLARDRRDVDLVVAGAQGHAARRPFIARRLADQGDHLRAFDRAEVVDNALRVRFLGADCAEVVLEEVRHDEPAALEELRPLEGAGEQLQLRELHRLVQVPEYAVRVRARLDELGRQLERLRRR